MNLTNILVSSLVVPWIVVATPVLATGKEPVTCSELIDHGTSLIQERPNRFPGDADPDGRPLTQSAKRYLADTQAAVAIWKQARLRCRETAAQESDLREAARLTALSYWVTGESLSVQRKEADACAAFAEGIEAVKAVEARSPHLAMLYDRLGFCIAEKDGARGAALMEEGLELAIEAYGARDSRIVDHMINLAVTLPYSVAPTGELDKMAGPRAAEISQRVAELYRAAWEIVQDDPSASKEAIDMAAGSYSLWLDQHGEDSSGVRTLHRALVKQREGE